MFLARARNVVGIELWWKKCIVRCVQPVAGLAFLQKAVIVAIGYEPGGIFLSEEHPLKVRVVEIS